MVLTRGLYLIALSLTTIADAKNALARIRVVFEAELFEETVFINENLDAAIEVKGASFTWDAQASNKIDDKKSKSSSKATPNESTTADDSKADKESATKMEEPFKFPT
jgi:hypothetical protein